MNAPRCHTHRAAPEAPRLCHTCQRIAVEQEIVARVVDALLAAGYLLQTDLREEPRPALPTADRETILAEMMEVDDEFLGVWFGHPVAGDFQARRLGALRLRQRRLGRDQRLYDDTWSRRSHRINEYADTLCA